MLAIQGVVDFNPGAWYVMHGTPETAPIKGGIEEAIPSQGGSEAW